MESSDVLFLSRYNDLLIIKNKEIISTIPIQCDEFYVKGYTIYFLKDKLFKSYHLMTQEMTMIENDVIQIHPTETGILIQTADQVKKYEI